MFAVVPLDDCPHTKQVVTKNFKPNVHQPCAECQNVGENMICLTCHQVHCGRHVNKHMLSHFEGTKHPLVCGFADISLWCYECEAYLDFANPKLYPFHEAVQSNKFNEDLVHQKKQKKLAAATAKQARFPRFGVSAEFLQDFVKEHGAALENLTTTEVCMQIIKPRTEGEGSYVEVARAVHQEGRGTEYFRSQAETRICGEATHFISHAWAYNFLELVEAVLAFHERIPTKQGGALRPYFWIDLFCVDQNSAPTYPTHWWSTTFMSAIQDFGTTVLVLMPVSCPVALTRAWCLWEIFSTIKTSSQLVVAMPPKIQSQFESAVAQNPREVLAALMSVDARNAVASSAKDLEMIFASIQSLVGFDRLNHEVMGQLIAIVLSYVVGDINGSSLDLVDEMITSGASLDALVRITCSDKTIAPPLQPNQSNQAQENPTLWRAPAVIHAARARHWAVVTALIAAGASPNIRDETGRSLVHWLCAAVVEKRDGEDAQGEELDGALLGALEAVCQKEADFGIADANDVQPLDILEVDPHRSVLFAQQLARMVSSQQMLQSLCTLWCEKQTEDANDNHGNNEGTRPSALKRMLCCFTPHTTPQAVPKTLAKFVLPGIAHAALELGIRVGNSSRVLEETRISWCMYVRATNWRDLTPALEKVEFHLHPTFRPPVVVLSKPPFEVERVGWGVFVILVRLFWRQNDSIMKEAITEVQHQLVIHNPEAKVRVNERIVQVLRPQQS